MIYIHMCTYMIKSLIVFEELLYDVIMKRKKWERKIKLYSQLSRGCPRGVMVTAMDCRIVVSEFVLQLRYYIHFRANTLRKGMNPLILPAIG